MQPSDRSDRRTGGQAGSAPGAPPAAGRPSPRPTPAQRQRIAAFRRELCGRFGSRYPQIAAAAVAAALVLGFAPPSRAGDIAFLVLFLFLLITIPSGMPRAWGFASSMRAVVQKGLLDALLQDWAVASARLEHGAALGDRFVFSQRDARFFSYAEIEQITPGPLVYERGRGRQGCTLLVVRLTGKRQVALGQCPKEPVAAYREARSRLEQAVRQRLPPRA